jgi:hypothetical protein
MSQNDTNGAEATAAAPSSSAASPSSAPEDRATTFQAVKGEPEHYSGEGLLVSAYAALWVIVFVWIALVWKKQTGLSSRLADLERVIDESARGKGKAAARAGEGAKA